jgi:site-specific recombinase XerD
MNDVFKYHSVLAPDMNGLIAIKESRGFNTTSVKWFFKEFDSFAINYGLKKPVITQELVDAWRKSRINDCGRTFYGKCSNLVQLARYMCERGKDSYIMRLPKHTNDRGYTPYIYSENQMQAIFEESNRLIRESHRIDDPIIAIPILTRLLYSTGLRITEAISIRNEDVHLDHGYIHIRKSKNGSERLVPICDTLKLSLMQYVKFRNRLPLKELQEGSHLFFVKLDGTEVSSSCAYKWFRKVYTNCGIPYKGDRFGPRLHDLRHSMAVHTLAKLTREGMDIYAALPLLSACLGHTKLSSTEHYVRLTCSEYPELLRQCSSLNDFIYPKRTTQ